MMKNIIYIVLLSGITLGCKTKTPERTVKEQEPTQNDSMITIHDNTALNLKIDYIGSLYYELIPDEEFMVVSYRYEEQTPEGTMDGHYIEEIYFQVQKPIMASSISNALLADNKAIFNRQCFCRGEAGTFLITEGTLTLEEKKSNYTFQFDFSISSGTQKTKHISGIIPKK